jgi:hypothetical protein
MQSTSAEMQSMSENDFECFASAGVMSPNNARLAGGVLFKKMVDLIGIAPATFFMQQERSRCFDAK